MLILLTISAVVLLSGAYYLLITKPIDDEQREEINFKNRQAAADAAIEQALRDDYSDLFNQNEN